MFEDGIIDTYVESSKKNLSKIKATKTIFQSVHVPRNKPNQSSRSDVIIIPNYKNKV